MKSSCAVVDGSEEPVFYLVKSEKLISVALVFFNFTTQKLDPLLPFQSQLVH